MSKMEEEAMVDAILDMVMEGMNVDMFVAESTTL